MKMPQAPTALLLAGTLLLQACDADPTPGQIARCRTDAGVTLPQTAKVRSLRLDHSAVDVQRCTTTCYNLLRSRDLDFVEFTRRGGPDDRVDRISLAPAGSPQCTPPFRRTPTSYPPERHQFRAPRGQCTVIEENQTPRAEAILQERIVPTPEHSASVREVVRPDGTLLALVLDYRTNHIEVAHVTCADVIRGFPRDTYGLILNHVTEPRRARR